MLLRRVGHGILQQRGSGLVAYFGLALTVIIAFGIFSYFTDADSRSKIHVAFKKEPAVWLWAVAGSIFGLTFLWGVLIPSFGTIKIQYWDYREIELWAAAGLASLAWFVAYMTWLSRRPNS